MSEGRQPVTERQNQITENIDVASPLGIASALQKCDGEIFGGYENSKGVLDDRVITSVEKVIDEAVGILQDPEHGLVVFSGCGTSGRIGFITARTFNRRLENAGKVTCYSYIIAGGDKALFTSQELYEDDPQHGAHMLQQVSQGKKRILYIGITCGLSAPFVAGQLDYCLQHLDMYTPVLLGFNSVSQARNIPIEKWDKTFLQVAKEMEKAASCGKAFILNPVVGPEPITGSSRMKGGTATKILLDVICTSAHAKTFQHDSALDVEQSLKDYRCVFDSVYKEKDAISQLIQSASESLKEDSHVYYVGQDTYGILGVIDASECRPTYGAALDDVRGFLVDGYSILKNTEGDISYMGEDYHISEKDFDGQVVPSLTEKDLLIYCNPGKLTAVKCPAQTALIITQGEVSHQMYSVGMTVRVGVSDARPDCVNQYQELALKLVLNAVSTGAHILKGKVYQNIMVDLRISNNKLFHRAIGIIQLFTKCSEQRARECLLRSIYSSDSLTSEQQTNSISSHIQHASAMAKVVPVALIVALTHCSVSAARLRLDQYPVIRSAIQQVISNSVP